MTTAEPANQTRITGGHRRRGWARNDSTWIDAELEQACSALDDSVRHDHLTYRASRTIESTETSEIVRKLVNDLLATDRGRELRTKEQVQNQYIDLVKEIPEVVEVRLVDDNGGQVLLTVISGTPFERTPRDKVYDAQIEVMENMKEPLLEFRLVNVREFAGRSIDELGSVPGITIWSH